MDALVVACWLVVLLGVALLSHYIFVRLRERSFKQGTMKRFRQLLDSFTLLCAYRDWEALHKRTACTCAVCLEELRPQDMVRGLRVCSHAFHAHCVERWLRTRASCPLCRRDVGLDADLQEYFDQFDRITGPRDGTLTLAETKEAIGQVLAVAGRDVNEAAAIAAEANALDGDDQDNTVAFAEFYTAVSRVVDVHDVNEKLQDLHRRGPAQPWSESVPRSVRGSPSPSPQVRGIMPGSHQSTNAEVRGIVPGSPQVRGIVPRSP